MRSLLLLLAAAFTLSTAPAAAAPPPPPRLVVAISVDQFSLELWDRYRPTFTGGLKRLAQGRVFAGWQSHAATETCPGHSTLLTGDHPSRTGIVANDWTDKRTGANVYCVQQDGTDDPAVRSSEKLKVDTLGDWMRLADPRSRVVAVSGKDRAAVTMGGHRATAALWWIDGRGFSPSTLDGRFDPASRAAAEALEAETAAAWAGGAFPRLWPAELPPRCAALQRPLRAGALRLSGRVPPDAAAGLRPGAKPLGDTAFARELRASPALDALTLAMAERLIDVHRLGSGPAPDLLAVSLSSTDSIGHRFGNGGAEMCAQMAALDRRLGAFFARLDRLGRPYLVVLTADHGAIDAAERVRPPGERLDVRTLVQTLNAELQARLRLAAPPLLVNDARELVVRPAAAQAGQHAAVVREAVAWLRGRPEVAALFTAEEIAAVRPARGKAPARLTLPERFAQSFDRERSGDIMVVYRERATLGVPSGPTSNVAGHGSPWDYDRRVPILFWGAGVRPSPSRRDLETVDIAPTLAARLRLPPPDVDGRCVELGAESGRGRACRGALSRGGR